MRAFVLAGGFSSRMGRDKALLPWQGQTLVELALEKLREIDSEPRILGAQPAAVEELSRCAPVIPDNISGCGPLSGIEAALTATDADLNLIFGVDLPLLPSAFLRAVAKRATQTHAGVTVPLFEGRPMPLCAVYHRALLEGVRAALAGNDYKVARVMPVAASIAGLAVDAFDVASWAAVHGIEDNLPVSRWFTNVNTPEDFETAQV